MKVLIILGSARKVRNTPVIGKIVHELVALAHPQVHFEVVDLKQWNLPYDAEEAIPMTGNYTSDEILKWSAKVASADAFVVVCPQYNWGYPAVLKNAIDSIYNEFVGKPVSIVTFGGHGGGKCNEQLQQVLGGGLKMKVTETSPQITIDKKFIVDHEVDEAALATKVKADILQAAGELVAMGDS